MTQAVSFPLFMVLWNRAQGLGTPGVHVRIADWLAAAWAAGDTRLLLMAFRSCGKSTIVGLFAAWLLWRRPDLRILVLAADMVLARKMVRNVKRIIERHPLTGALKPARADQWGADRFTVRRDRELRDPSMLARGIAANMTGSRADIVICDDVEVPKTCDTAEKRADLREKLAEIDFVLTPGGMQLYVGTPHSWYTIYADEARAEIAEDVPFLHGFSRLVVPVEDEDGTSAWPERFPPAAIAAIKRRTGPNRFAAQMLLRPVNSAEGRLDIRAMSRYAAVMRYDRVQDALYVGDTRMAACSAFWDPAFGRGGDGSVLAVLYVDGDGEYWLHRVEYLRVDQFDAADEMTQQCRKVAFILQMMQAPFVAVEDNGLGKFLPGALRRELGRARVACAVRTISHTRAKDVRIMEAFDPVLAARMLRVHEDVFKTPFPREVSEWAPGRKGGKDDGLDAVAGALAQAPVLIGGGARGRQTGKQAGWHAAGQTHTARSDFDV